MSAHEEEDDDLALFFSEVDAIKARSPPADESSIPTASTSALPNAASAASQQPQQPQASHAAHAIQTAYAPHLHAGQIQQQEQQQQQQQRHWSGYAAPHQSYGAPAQQGYAPPAAGYSGLAPSFGQRKRRRPTLRLVVQRSKILTPSSVAMIAPDEDPTDVGRDLAHAKRLRLKEMEVSKLHATIFWSTAPAVDKAHFHQGWSVIDRASTQGTFLNSPDQPVQRLSAAKATSRPVKLYHGDELTLGTTTFQVHLHDTFACWDAEGRFEEQRGDCPGCVIAQDQSNWVKLERMPLETRGAAAAPELAPLDVEPGPDGRIPLVKTKAIREKERVAAMSALRKRYLRAKSEEEADREDDVDGTPAYVDRSAIRRSTQASDDPPPPAAKRAKKGGSSSQQPEPVKHEPDQTVFTDSKAAQMLQKMMANSASTSADPSATAPTGLGTLIEAKTLGVERAGLGSREAVTAASLSEAHSGSWRDKVREQNRQRWQEMSRKHL